MAKADPAQVRALVAAYAPSGDTRRALALRADPEWAGPEVLEAAGRAIRVVACRAPLSVREALVQHAGVDELLVVLTPFSGAELGLDVRARLVKGDVLPLDPFSSVLALFGAAVLDPQLVGERWLIDDLVALAPAEGWRAQLPLGGALDAAAAWRTWHLARLRVDAEPASLLDLLRLGDRPAVAAAVSDLREDRRARLGTRWAETTGYPAAPVLADLIAGGRGRDVVALGLVAGALWATTDRADVATAQSLARARLEDRFGRDRLDRATAQAWADAASELLAGTAEVSQVVDAAERELARADAGALAAYADQLPSGFELRLRALADALTAGDLDAATAALAWVQAHHLADRRRHRVEAAEAAVRLLRRRGDPRPVPTGFAASAADYAAEGAFLDAAVRLLDDGDVQPELSAAYAALVADAAAERAQRTTAFVADLADWSRSEPAPDERIVPLERLLDDVVAPVAADAPVLLVVCDGLGLPVAQELLRDLRAEHWAPAAPVDRTGWPVGIALLPTVTEASRTALLTGTRQVGGQAEERAGFAAHPALRAASSPARPPVLFHKAALVGPSGTALPDGVRAQVADPDQRVVGVVVNAVDDHLARGDQVRVGWDLASLRPLAWLLDAAAEAGRIVVLTADHGHVLHDASAVVRQLPGGGERWRPASSPAADGEVEVAGPRVLLGGGRVVLPADRRLHYGGHKHGYHGGATPEEVLVPVAVLARHLPEGWHHLPSLAPSWWSDAPAPVLAATPVAASPAPVPPRGGQASLFEPEPAAAAAPSSGASEIESWIDELLASPAFVANRGRVRLPRPIPDLRLRSYLVEIDANGGSMPLTALAARTGEPPDTLRMALSIVQRLVNLDGAEILAVRSDGSIELNRPLAALQFELASA